MGCADAQICTVSNEWTSFLHHEIFFKKECSHLQPQRLTMFVALMLFSKCHDSRHPLLAGLADQLVHLNARNQAIVD